MDIFLKNSTIGENCEFRVFQNHPDFELFCGMNGVNVDTGSLEGEENFVKVEIVICRQKPTNLKGNSSNFNFSLMFGENIKGKLERVEKIKKSADGNFKAGDYKQAIQMYKQCYNVLSYDNSEEATDMKRRILLNLSFAYYKDKQYKECIKWSRVILDEYEDDNFKVYFRLAKAYLDCGDFDSSLEAWQFAKLCVEEESENWKDVEKEIKRVYQMMRKSKAKERMKMLDQIRREEKQAEESTVTDVKRVDDFETVKLLGEGNFSVRIFSLMLFSLMFFSLMFFSL